uniref:Uncharacterized protein n=1 Tax=Rhinolophus ferrumequinum TaxID=59479 RepID=A0A671G2S6_RHIFE
QPASSYTPALGCPCSGSGAHTCIHIVGPPAGLAAASCWGAACPRIEDIVDRALHLAVIDGLGALGGAGKGEEGSGGPRYQYSGWSSRAKPSNASLAPPSTSNQPPGPGEATEALTSNKNASGCHKTLSSSYYFILNIKYENIVTF